MDFTLLIDYLNTCELYHLPHLACIILLFFDYSYYRKYYIILYVTFFNAQVGKNYENRTNLNQNRSLYGRGKSPNYVNVI